MIAHAISCLFSQAAILLHLQIPPTTESDSCEQQFYPSRCLFSQALLAFVQQFRQMSLQIPKTSLVRFSLWRFFRPNWN